MSMKLTTTSRPIRWVLIIVLLATVIWRLIFLIMDVVAFDGDEAIVGLMAKHILEGERPIYFYGQAYMGSLDAYILALGFLVFGIHVWVIRIIQISLFMVTVLVLIQTGRKLFGNPWIGLIAGAFLAIPPINLTNFTIPSLGGYGEILLLSSIDLLIFTYLRERLSEKNLHVLTSWFLYLLFGFVSGLGVWTHYLTIVISVPCFIFLFIKLCARREYKYALVAVLIIFLGFLIGLTPMIIFGIKNGWTLLLEALIGKAITQEGIHYLNQLFSHVFNLIFLGMPVLFGLRPPWEPQLLLVPILPIIVSVYIMILIKAVRKIILDFQNSIFLMVCIIGLFFILFIFSPFGVDPSGRYFLPLYIPLAFFLGIGLADGWKKKWVGIVLAMILLGFNIASTFTSALKNPPGFTAYLDATTRIDHRYDHELLQFLKTNDITRGYSTYSVSYLVDFRSNEEIIFTPRLSYRQNFVTDPIDMRYPPYDEEVSKSEKVAYITVKSKEMDDVLVSGFKSKNIQWDEAIIGDYNIYFNLSERISPDEIFKDH